MATEERLFDVLGRFLDKDSRHRHLLILADSGMGKSSCLINYYVRNQRLPPRRRRRIAVIPLGIPHADDLIRKIDEQGGTVLFLDAFDEDTKAIRDHRARLLEVMDLCRAFNRVVLTCRTQFFPRDEEIPKDTGIVKVEPKGAGELGTYVFQKLYLAPFNDDQVDQFLKRRYPAPQWKRRRSARNFVAAVPLLSVRPMLLAHIPDLVQSEHEISYGFELYERLIESWLQRESAWAKPETLRQFSEQLAVDLYCNRERRGAEWIPSTELAQLVKGWSLALEDWQLTGRSLLNRDAAGNYKFAHRSIMEYLFVRETLAGNPCAMGVEWTDQMIDFLYEIIFNGRLPVYLERRRGTLTESDVRGILRLVGINVRCEGREFLDHNRLSEAQIVSSRYFDRRAFRREHLEITSLGVESRILGLQWFARKPNIEWAREPTVDELFLLDHMPEDARNALLPKKSVLCPTADTLHGYRVVVGFRKGKIRTLVGVEQEFSSDEIDLAHPIDVMPAFWLIDLIMRKQLASVAPAGEFSRTT
ncbi:MAG TPA: hypothetical protein VF121_00175 [Thermoanaerobaculia bacterium]|nr:hypothetical protein [Thermoanaerobaculia bacterium]